jgi:hypothetical protein
MTAAGLGSRFSVEGTIIGAALASVIAAVAGALYTASLRRTHQTVRGVLGRRLTNPARQHNTSAPAQPMSGVAAAVVPGSPPSLAGTVDNSAKASRRRALVVRSVVGAAATFALAAAALTMYEALTGHALSGGSGTTFSQVQQDESEDRPTDQQPATPTESADPSPTAEPTAEPSPGLSEEPSVTPEAESSPTAEPSAEPSAKPPATSEAEPSATTAPPSSAPSQASQAPR